MGKIGVLVAVVLAAAVVVLVAYTWNAMGDVQISLLGWLALVLGCLGTLALGIGLMALVFYSSRYGFDDEAGSHGDGAGEREPR